MNTRKAKFAIRGLNHLGLIVNDISLARDWFVNKLEMKIIQDRGNILFLAVGEDILAIKTPDAAVSKPEFGDSTQYPAGEAKIRKDTWQSLDHYGFFAQSPEEVDHFVAQLKNWQIEILKGPYDRSDGRSVYFRDPCGNVGEFFFFRGFAQPHT
jgi:catechol 2,3-dioxygenase-like lactoylglutathione lyase family enzyme